MECSDSGKRVCDFDGSDSLKCISLVFGDQLSAVHALDETWYIGFNERTKKTGAFPSACVEADDGNDYTPLPAKNGSTDGLPENPAYANVSKQIQERKASQLHKDQRSGKNLAGPLAFDVNKLRKTKPEKSFKLKMVANPEEGKQQQQQGEAKAEDLFSKSNTLRSVRFDDIKIEHSISIPESATSWQDSSFEDSFRDQLANYDGYYNGETKSKSKRSVKKEISNESNHSFGKLSSFKSSTENLIKSSKEEKRGVKAIIGVIAGLLIGGLMFLVYYYSFGYKLVEAGMLVAVLTVLICVGMALSSFIRCIIALVVPNFFTGIGRAILLSAIFALILNYPISNISHNARETGSSMACVVELAANQTRILQRQLAVPIEDLTEYVQKQQAELKQFTKILHSKFSLVKDVLDKLGEGTATAVDALKVIREKCQKVVGSSKTECERICGASEFPITELCNNQICGKLDFSKSCEGIELGVDLNDIAKKTRSALMDAINYFDVDMVVSGEFSGNANVSKPAEAIQAEVEKDIGGKLDLFDSVMSVIRKCLSLSLFLIFLQSFWYLRNYLAKDGYDNIYITKQFKEMDKEAEKNGRETVLPLKKREKDEYVNTSSIKLNSTELSYSKLGLVQVLLHFLLCVLVIIFDYALYYILNLVSQYGDIELEIESRGRMTIAVDGNGPVADFYKLLVKNYNIDRNFNITLDIEPCLPQPQEPSAAMIPVFLVLYLIALAVVLLRAYGMRLRRKVSAFYCPEQELARLDYLHKKIRHKRVGFLKFLRQQIKSTHKEEQVKNQLRFSTWLAFNFPFIAQLLPKKDKLECTSCGQQETSFNKVKLTKCDGTKGGVTCDAVYCEECHTALQKTCPLCSSNNDVVLRE